MQIISVKYSPITQVVVIDKISEAGTIALPIKYQI